MKKKKKKKKEKRKERGQMSHSEIKRDLAVQVLPKFFKFSKRGIEIFLKELSIHHHHPFTPYNHFYSIYHLQPSTI
jgi:hypothetical protein